MLEHMDEKLVGMNRLEFITDRAPNLVSKQVIGLNFVNNNFETKFIFIVFIMTEIKKKYPWIKTVSWIPFVPHHGKK